MTEHEILVVEPGRTGPGPHAHEANEELFYVLDGTMSFQVGEQVVDAAAVRSCASRPASCTTSRTAAMLATRDTP
jgi:uncharacterized cupin superfamily protein